MKILVVSNLYPPDVCGGYELGCRQAVDALRARGHEVLVLTTAPRVPVPSEPHVNRGLKLTDLWDSYSDANSAEVAISLQHSEAFQISAFNVHALIRAVEEFQPDVVYLWMIVGVGGLGLVACLQHLRVPWVWHLMDDVPPKLCSIFYEVRPELVNAFSREFQGTFLSCSGHLLREISRHGFELGDRVEVISNWMSGSLPPLRREFRQPSEPLRVVSAAATLDASYDKGIGLLLNAVAIARDAGDVNMTLDIYGQVNDRSIESEIQSLKLSNLVKLRGSLSQRDLINAYANYDLFTFPGRPNEPFGFAPLEALPTGCVPLISSRSGVSEWLIHGVNCLKAPRTAKAFALALGQVIRGEIALGPIGTRGAVAVRREFPLDRLILQIETALKNASGRSRLGAGTSAEAYRLAVLAEKLSRIFIQSSFHSKKTA